MGIPIMAGLAFSQTHHLPNFKYFEILRSAYIKRKNLFQFICPTGSFTCPGPSGSGKRRALNGKTTFLYWDGPQCCIYGNRTWRWALAVRQSRYWKAHDWLLKAIGNVIFITMFYCSHEHEYSHYFMAYFARITGPARVDRMAIAGFRRFLLSWKRMRSGYTYDLVTGVNTGSYRTGSTSSL